MASYTNIFGGSPTQTSQVSLLDLALTEDTELSWPTQYQDTNNVVSHIIDVSPDEDGLSLTLPDATLVSVGQDVLINNPSVYDFSLLRNDGTLLANVASGNILYFYLIDNTSEAGTWRTIPFGGGVAAVTEVNADVPDPTDADNLTITGVPITSAGTISFAFDGDIAALIGFGGSTGIAVRTGVEAWALREITPVTNGNVVVNNQDGVAGDITIDLSSDIGIVPSNPINSLRVGNLTFSANGITSSDLDGDIELTPNGDGLIEANSDILMNEGNAIEFYNVDGTFSISLSSGDLDEDVGLVWPQAPPVAGQVLQFAGGGDLAWVNVTTFFGAASTDKAIARFNGTGGQIQDTGIIIDDLNNLTTPTSLNAGTELNVGTLSISATNVISTSAGSITVSPVAGSSLNVHSNVFIGTAALNRTLLFQSGVFTVSLTAPALAGNVALTLPGAIPTANNQSVVGSTAGLLTFSPISMPAAAATANRQALVGNPAGLLTFSPISMPLAAAAANNQILVGSTGGFLTFSPLSLPAAAPAANDQILVGSTAGLLTFSPLTSVVATQVDMQNATSVINPVIPANFQYHPGVVKSFADFVGATGAINQSYNVANIVRNGVGDYTINFTTAFAAATYAIQISINSDTSILLGYGVVAKAAGSFQINIYDNLTIPTDPTSISFSCLGQQ